MTMLLIAGIAVLAVGLVAVVFGIPVKEFSFGNTLILAGAVAACTGILMLGLAVVVRELQNIARRLGTADPAAAARAKSAPPLPAPADDQPAPGISMGRRQRRNHRLRRRLPGRKKSRRGIARAAVAMASPKRRRRSRRRPSSRGAICCSRRHRAGSAIARRARPMLLPRRIPASRPSLRRRRKNRLRSASKTPGRKPTARGPMPCGGRVQLRPSPSRARLDRPPRPSRLRQPRGAKSRLR